jgi:hypothetical protein
MIKRRYFVFSTIAGLIGLRFATISDASSIVAVLRKRLNYLRLDDVGLQRFAQDLAAQHQLASSHLKLVGAAGPLYTHMPTTGRNLISNGIRHGEERIITTYLLSSDFFINGSDELRVVRYLGFYDPLRACSNPFARRIESGPAMPAAIFR